MARRYSRVIKSTFTDDYVNENFRNFLYESRLKKYPKSKDFTDAVGYSYSFVKSTENGHSIPNLFYLANLAQILDVDIYTFINRFFGFEIEHSNSVEHSTEQIKKYSPKSKVSHDARKKIATMVTYYLGDPNHYVYQLANELEHSENFVWKLKTNKIYSVKLVNLQFMLLFSDAIGIKFDTLKKILLDETITDDTILNDEMYRKIFNLPKISR
jgi:transcriptional regulator with XRE-family HTH domain